MADSVDDALSNLVSQAAATVRSDTSRANASTPDPTDRMMSIFAEAFPDQNFTRQGGTVIGTPRSLDPNRVNVPAGYAPNKADIGIQEMRTALEAPGLTDEEKYSMAVRLNSMVQVQKMYKFNEYRAQAEAMYAIPDLLQTIESLKRAEAVSPYNPGGGAMSQQRFQVIQNLASARTQAAGRVKELMATDPTYAEAEALAGGVVSEIEGRLKIAERGDRIDRKRIAEQERNDRIAAVDPSVLSTIGIMRNGKVPSPQEQQTIAGQYIDGKLKLSKTEQFLVTADDNMVKNLYNNTKDVKEKQLASQVMLGRETIALDGDAKQAKTNLKLYETVMSIDPSDKTNTAVSPDIRRRWQGIKQDAMRAKAAGSSKSDEELINERKFAIHNEMLSTAVRNATFGNVKEWKGVIASDPAAQAVLKIWQGNRNMNVNDFIDKYLEYNDGRKPQEKSASLRAIITSAITAIPQSTILPRADERSALMQAENMVISRSAQNAFGHRYDNIIGSGIGGFR